MTALIKRGTALALVLIACATADAQKERNQSIDEMVENLQIVQDPQPGITDVIVTVCGGKNLLFQVRTDRMSDPEFQNKFTSFMVQTIEKVCSKPDMSVSK